MLYPGFSGQGRRILAFSLLVFLFFCAENALATSWKIYRTADGLPDDSVTGIATTSRGTVWISTLNGAAMYDGTSFLKFDRTNSGLPDNVVWSVDTYEAPNGNVTVWFATGNGVAAFDGSRWTTYIGKHLDKKTGRVVEGNCPLASNVVNKVLVAFDGKKDAVWFLSQGQLAKFDGECWSRFEFGEKLLKKHEITTMAGVPNEGALWLGTDGMGIMKYDMTNRVATKHTAADGLASNYVNALFVDSQNRLWVGTDQGVSIFDGKTFINYNYRNSLLVSDFVTTITNGFGNDILVGTDRGISVYDGSNWTSTKEGLGEFNGKVIWAIAQVAPAGKDYAQLWVGTRGAGLGFVQVAKDVKENLFEDHSRRARQFVRNRQYSEAILEFEELLRLRPDDTNIKIELARCYININQDLKAKNLLTDVIKTKPDSRDALFELGNLYFKEQEFDRAAETFKALITLSPRESEAYLKLAEIAGAKKDYRTATRMYEQALTIDQELVPAYKGLYKVKMASLDYAGALEVLRQLQFKRPDDDENNIEIARLLIYTGRTREASGDLEQVLSRKSDNVDAVAYYACVQLEKGEVAAAKSALERILKINFSHGIAHANMALVAVEMSDIAGALKEIGYANTFAPNDPYVRFAAGRVAEIQGNFQDALEEYRLAIENGFDTANVHYRVANCLKSLEKYDEALEEYKKVLQMDPNFQRAEDVKWMISKLETPTEDALLEGATNLGEPVTGGSSGTGGISESSKGNSSSVPVPDIDELDF